MRRATSFFLLPAALAWAGLALAPPARGADVPLYYGDTIPPELEVLYMKGLNYLVSTQNEAGYWPGLHGNEPGVVGLATLAMLAHGDDPNFGPYAVNIRRAIGYILSASRDTSGCIGMSMYNHGFATLALAEAYGAVNDRRIGPALKKAVELILSSQARNPFGAWRYSPDSQDADTTVSGAQMVALVAARNAGLGVPEEALEKGLKFYRSCQTGDGGFGYTNNSGTSQPRAAIGTLVFALTRRKDTPEFKAAFRNLQQISATEEATLNYFFYYLYYAAQAHFHGSMDDWKVWNARVVKLVEQRQQADGSWDDRQGPAFSTSTALLVLAVNYRLLPIYER